jgi:hypothetical protein
MKVFLVLLCLFFWSRFSFTQSYNIHFLQDGIEIPIINEKVLLAKKPFQIQVELLKVDGVFGSSSLSDSLFRIPLNQSLPEPDLIQWKIAVEPENNVDKDIIISKESYFYWFYNPKVDTWHRFDPNPIVEKRGVVGTKTVENLFISEHLNSENKSISISKIEQPLYFIFFLMNKNNEQDLQRMRIQVNWK